MDLRVSLLKLAIKIAKRKIKGMRDVLVVNHYDADGISSSALVRSFLRSNDIEYEGLTVSSIDEKIIKKAMEFSNVIFVDLGNQKEVERLENDVLIIDHHIPQVNKPQLNPHFFGIDGSEVATATLAYFFHQRADIAIAGIIGDHQEIDRGLNKEILEEGIKKGEIIARKDILQVGKEKNLVEFLASIYTPYLPGFSGRRREIQWFIGEYGIEKERRYDDARREIVEMLLSAFPEYANSLFGRTLLFPKMPKEVNEGYLLATLLNAAGREGKGEEAIKFLMGEREKIVILKKALERYKEKIKKGIEIASKTPLEGGVYFIDGRGKIGEEIAGIIASIWYSQTGKTVMIIANAKRRKGVKASIRSSEVNVGKFILENQLEGNGHERAGGFYASEEKAFEIVEKLREKIKKLRKSSLQQKE